MDDERTRVEVQGEVDAPREPVYRLLATAEGLASWLDEAELEPRVGGRLRVRMRDAVATGTVVALDPPQHISFTWDWEAEPIGGRSVVAFDAIEHGARTHVTVRQVGLRTGRQLELHAELWRYWFDRFRAAANAVGREPRG